MGKTRFAQLPPPRAVAFRYDVGSRNAQTEVLGKFWDRVTCYSTTSSATRLTEPTTVRAGRSHAANCVLECVLPARLAHRLICAHLELRCMEPNANA